LETQFVKLNQGWNAEPNAPDPSAHVDGVDVLLRFFLNPYKYKNYREEDIGVLRFMQSVRYRLGSTNDTGWYLGQCRYSGTAPSWGEFYEVRGDDPLRLAPKDWIIVENGPVGGRHFLFYFRDHTFECIATDWCFEQSSENALFRENPLK
jgi:hypothetical protein